VNDGQLFENCVINQLSSYGEISFYNKQGSEIDAILERKIAFEIKLTGTEQDHRKLNRLSTVLGIPRHFVIAKNFSEKAGIISALSV
jgi:Predicted ATPase (AAA+ superfamily)